MTTVDLDTSAVGHTGRRPEPARSRGTGTAMQILLLTSRSVRALVLDPRAILLSLLMPLLMLLAFSQIFATMATATSILPQGGSYLEYLLPAIMVNTAMQSGLQAGSTLTEEMRNGIVARFRAMPIWLGSVLVARSLAHLTRSLLQLVILLLLATIGFGFSPPGGFAGTTLALAVAIVVGGGMGWISIALASWLRNADLMQDMAAFLLLPLLFASSAFVPVDSLPAWLAAIAKVNPLTYGIDAARGLTLGEPHVGATLAALAVSITACGICMAVAVRGFRRPL